MGADESATVDVLVVNYRTPELTRQACADVAGADTRVLVWDNSGDLDQLPGATLCGDGANHYFAAANNRLFGMGTSPYVLLLNPDVALPHAVLTDMLSRLRHRPDVWGVTPRLVGTDARAQNYLHGFPTTRGLIADRLPPLRPLLSSAYRAYRCADTDLTAESCVRQPPAAALLIRRSQVLAAGGLFDEAYPLFFNDVDLARRMSRFGQCLYAGDLAALHVGGASITAASQRAEPVWRMYDDALVTYADRHLGGTPLIRAAVRARRLVDTVARRRRR